MNQEQETRGTTLAREIRVASNGMTVQQRVYFRFKAMKLINESVKEADHNVNPALTDDSQPTD